MFHWQQPISGCDIELFGDCFWGYNLWNHSRIILSKFIWLGSSRRLQHCDGFNMTVCGADVQPVDCVRDIGVLIDSNMTLSNHVNNVAGIWFYHLLQLRIIRRFLIWRRMLHIRCFGLWSIPESTTATDSWPPVPSTCTRSYSPSSVLLPDSFCSNHTVRLFRKSCEDSYTGSRSQIVSDLNCIPLYTDACTDSILTTCLISVHLPQATLIWDHLWHSNGRCQSPGRKPRQWVSVDST